VFIRLALFAAVGSIGCSSVYWLLYLALPAWAALLISQKGGERYLRENAPGMVRVLDWVAAAYAYLWLLTDTPPHDVERERIATPEPMLAPAPTITSAMTRLLSSLPALVVLAVASCVAAVLWLLGVLAILLLARVPAWVVDFLAAILRYQYRLLGYHLSVVDRYPSFDSSELPEVHGSTMA